MNARRLDWHVLLPRPAGPRADPRPGRWLVLGGPPDLPGLAVTQGLAATASADPGEAAPADVVALLAGATPGVEAAAAALAPGGLLYWEVDRRSVRGVGLTPGRLRRRLAAAGLVPLGLFWVGPGWDRPARFLPLDAAGPLRWYATARAFGSGPGTGVGRGPLRAAVRQLIGRPWLAGLLAPRVAVVAARPPAPPSRLPAILDDEAVPAGVRSAGILPILVSGGPERWSRITLLGFADAEAPSVAVKVAREPASDAATRHEHAVLVDLHARADAALRATLPDPLAEVAAGPGGRAAIVQGAVHGVAATARLGVGGTGGRGTDAAGPTDLERVADWLVDLHRLTLRGRAAPGSAEWRTHLDGPFDRFGATFDPPPDVARLLDRTRTAMAEPAVGLPIVLRHMDVGPWNVLVDGPRLRVIDWEVARDGAALTDLVYAALHWDLAERRTTGEPARRARVRRLFGPAGAPDGDALGAHPLVRALIDRFTTAVGLDPRLVPGLVLLALIEQALDRWDRLAAVGERDPDPWTDNRYAGYLAELARPDRGRAKR